MRRIRGGLDHHLLSGSLITAFNGAATQHPPPPAEPLRCALANQGFLVAETAFISSQSIMIQQKKGNGKIVTLQCDSPFHYKTHCLREVWTGQLKPLPKRPHKLLVCLLEANATIIQLFCW